MKSLAIVATTLLFVSGALADPIDMHSPKLRGHSRDTPTDNPETVFEPIVPCRAFSGQNLSAGNPRHFLISGDSTFQSQGGPNAGCGVPVSASAVMLSLTSTASSGNGSITAYAYGATPPGTRALSFHSGGDETAGIAVGLGSNSIALRANGSGTKVAGDVTGYYAPQIEAYIYNNGSIYSQTARILSVAHTGTGTYTITVDRDVLYCAVQVMSGTSANIASGYGNTSDVVDVSIFSGDGNQTPTDDNFNLTVNC